MRICHVITKPELGGAQISTLNLLSRLSRDRYTVSIITSPCGILKPDFENLKKTRLFPSLFLVRPVNPIVDILAFIHIFLIYSSYRASLVHTHSSKAGIIGRWAALLYNLTSCRFRVKGEGCKVIHTVHGWSFNDYQPMPLKRFFILLERITARFTTKIICVSKKDLEIGLKYKIAPEEKFTLIKYGIPLKDFRKSLVDKLQKRKELGIHNSDPVVGMISCLKPQKAPLDYIKASIKVYERMPRVNFLLVGDGVLRKRCEKFLSTVSLNGRFIFAGWRRDVSEILNIMDVAVLTSKWEGMPISLIEALCSGCPVVATDIGGTSELIKEGVNGYITQAGSYKETAEKILKILNDPVRFNDMKKQAALTIDESFDANRMTREIDELYKSLT